MECLFAFKGKDYVILAVDPTTKDRIIKTFPTQKHFNINNIHYTFSGEQSDYSRITNFTSQKLLFNNKVYQIPINITTVSKVIQNKIYKSLRERPNYQVNSIITDGVKLLGVDEYGCLFEEKRIALGYGLYFLNGIFDNLWNENINLEEGKVLLKRMLKVLKEKFLLNVDQLDCKVVFKEGVENIMINYE
ncbi:putative proteasome subunit beta type-4 [Tubulinosema ratisbonensis]|uniref:Putative proteasome subunit beta type-4 n=1 Tax=Tubulinosema ratisbonensis TaxID=291195 RepID=A0A437AMK2_9MICR|nr:putative proteasome subunit beta type-4 [Tubulinosema ratisbonensis]